MSYEKNYDKGWFKKSVSAAAFFALNSLMGGSGEKIQEIDSTKDLLAKQIESGLPKYSGQHNNHGSELVQLAPQESPMYQDYLHDKEVAFKKKAADPATTAQVVQELEAHIQNSQTPEGIDEIINLFEQNKRWT